MVNITEIIQQYGTINESPAKLICGCVLVLLIAYSSEVPHAYKRFIDSPIGRVFGIAAVYGAIHYVGWVYGLLTAMAFLLLLHGGIQMREGFDGGVASKRTSGNRWFVERVLGEIPSKIETDRVNTSAPGSTS